MAEYEQFRGERDRVGPRKKMCILVAVRLELVGGWGEGYLRLWNSGELCTFEG